MNRDIAYMRESVLKGTKFKCGKALHKIGKLIIQILAPPYLVKHEK
jgi:hypothetical protein